MIQDMPRIRQNTMKSLDSVLSTRLCTFSKLGVNKQLKCETKNKMMSVIGPVQSHYHEGSPVGKRSLTSEGFVEKSRF